MSGQQFALTRFKRLYKQNLSMY